MQFFGKIQTVRKSHVLKKSLEFVSTKFLVNLFWKLYD